LYIFGWGPKEKIVKRVTNARTMRAAAFAAVMLVLFVSMDWAQRNGGRGGGAQRSAPGPRFSQPRSENRQMRQMQRQENRQQFRQEMQPRMRNENNFPARDQQQNNLAPSQRPGVNEPRQPNNGAAPQTYGNRQPFGGAQPGDGARPVDNGGRQTLTGAQPGNARQPYGGPHLQDWLSRNQNVPVQDQERQLRNDPSFKRLPQADQQRLTQQLRSVDRMTEQQRDRRLARNEMLERLSPEERMSINRSGRAWSALPSDRQLQMRRAFQDLRGVPLDQRQTVLNSARYQNMFTPQERGILSDFLRAEPYEPQR
jgi:hypothetical protein